MKNMKKGEYWHLQMFKPKGRDGNRTFINSILMLQEEKPIIGTGEWDSIQCRNFKRVDDKGLDICDIVFVREGQKAIALCEVISACFQDVDLTAKYMNINFRYVKVLEDYSRIKIQPFPQAQGTLQILRGNGTDSWKYIDKLYNKVLNNMNTQQIKDILLEKKQIILQGAPGTGKTYSTAALALSIIGESYDSTKHDEIMKKYEKLVKDKRIFFTTFHQSMDYEDFVEGLRPREENGNITYYVRDGIFKEVCKKARTREDLNIIECIDKYLEKIKNFEQKRLIPTKSGKSNIYVWWTEGNETISVRSEFSKSEKSERSTPSPLNIEKVKLQAIGEGIENNWSQYAYAFIQAVKKEFAFDQQTNAKPYVLIIDEINRGNISKIFGELITLLESDKRQDGTHTIPMKLTYSEEDDFTVPSNLYIIGTMNTTDRSVGHIDYAVRRRFAFYTLKADKDIVESYYNQKDISDGTKDIAMNLFKQINKLVGEKKPIELDAEDLMVGHSYFMAETIDKLKMKLEYEIIPLLREYEKDGILSISIEDLRKYEEIWTSLFPPKV